MKNRLAESLPAIGFLLLLLIVWQWLVAGQWVPAYLVPSPLEIAVAIADNRADIAAALLGTLGAVLYGLGLSIAVGVAAAVMFFSVPLMRRAVLPFCVFFQTVPIIAVAPLLVIWFGYGAPTVRASAFIVSVFPILANTLSGLQQTDPQLRELFSLYRPSALRTIAKLNVPAALPFIFTGLRIAVGLAVIGAIVGEFIAGGGVGGLIDSARTQQRVDLVFAGVAASSLLAMFLILAIDGVTRLLAGRRPYLRKAP